MVVSELQFAVEQIPQMAAIVTTFIPIAIGCVGYFLKGKWHTVQKRQDVPAGAKSITELKHGDDMGIVSYRGGLKIQYYHTCSPDAPKDKRGLGFTATPIIS